VHPYGGPSVRLTLTDPQWTEGKTMTHLRRGLGIGAIVIAALGFALPAEAVTKIDRNFDSLAQQWYYGGSQPTAVGNGWYVTGAIWVGSPSAAEPGSAVPSASNSVRLSEVSCIKSCQRMAGTMRALVRTTPGRPVTVSILAAAGRAGMYSELLVHGLAQEQPDVAAELTSPGLDGSGNKPLGSLASGGLKWERLVWTLQPTSAYTMIVVSPGVGADVWVDDISLRCGS
jgi:hypothetical protein